MKNNFTVNPWKIMKVFMAQGMLAMIVCGVSLANTGVAQLLEKEISITLLDAPFEKALLEIEKTARVKFAYSPDQLSAEQNVSLKAEKKYLRDVLDELLAGRGIRYKVHEREGTITLKKERRHAPLQGVNGEEHILSTSPALPALMVQGKVTDASTQLPLPGVNIIVKGTTNGTTSDADGNFTLRASENDVLVFSFIGFRPLELKIDGRDVIDVAMEPDVTDLKEVEVNAGYWTVKKQEQTGNIVKIQREEIEKQPVSNPLAALQGRVSGLEITQSTGVPGGNFKVRIRGTNSIANGNEPLYIIDGVPFISGSMSFLATSSGILGDPQSGQGTSPLNSINPADIESIEVLKDADATAIYGSRGSNGVILITTKKGQAGKTKIDVNVYTGVATVARKADLLSTAQYVEIRKEAFANDNIIPTVADAADLTVWDTTRYTDWQSALIGGTAHTTDAQLSISGGEQRTQFSIGAGYHRESTVFPGDNSDHRFSTHVNVSNTSANEKLRTTISLNYAVNKSDLPGTDLTERALALPPNAPALYLENGDLSWENWTPAFENPIAYQLRRYESHTANLVGNLSLGYMILPTLEVKSSFGYTDNQSEATYLTPLSSLHPSLVPFSKNTSSFSASHFKNWLIEPQLNWRPRLGEGQFDILAGSTFLDQTTEGLAQVASGFASESLMKNIGAATERTLATNYYRQYRYHAVFGRVNYSWKKKYIINLTGRRDGSSRFGPGKQFANFGAVGAAWIFSEEPKINNALPFISFGKLRTSYGLTGNDQLGDYQYLDAYTIAGTGYYQTGNGLTPARLSNPEFAWEANRKFEAALEVGLAENRILTSFSYYHNRSSNQLVGFPLPLTTGFTSVQGNFPATVQNTGVEVELNTMNIEHRDFTWSTSLNVTVPRNKLIQFPNLASFPAYSDRHVVGEPLSIVKAYEYTGVDPSTGNYTFTDWNSDGLYDQQDRQTVKFLGQDFFGGLQNAFRFKNFQLDVLFQFVKQQGYDQLPGIPGGSMNNQDISVLKRWQRAGDNTELAKAGTLAYYPALLYSGSDRAVTNASYIRLKNLSLSYMLPEKITQRLHFISARFFIQGQNLMTSTAYKKGLDPETQNLATLPPLRTLTAGLHFTF
jgi:TonB-dependent starch-binding outer membrane protein SusC